MRGKLTEQLPEDGTAEELYQQIQAEKQALIKAGKIKKEKPLQEILNEEIPYSIPANWKWVRIGAVLTLQSGKNIMASDIKNVPDANHIIPCYGGNGQRGFVSQANVDGFHAIIGRQGALCGNINFAEGPFYATEHAVVVYEYAATNIKWAGITLRYLNLNQYATSVAQPGLAVNKIDNVPMPLPPFAEQHRIVERVEQACSLLDTIDALQAKYADNLTVLKSKLIDAAIQGKLTEQLPEDGTAEELYQQIQAEKQSLIKAGKIKKEKTLPEITADEIPFEIPSNWKWYRIGSILTLQSGKSMPASGIVNAPDAEHMIPCYGGNGQRGFVGQANVDDFHAIIGRQGALCGNINFAEGPFYATEHAVVVYGYAEINMKWVGITLRYLNLNQYATSVAQPGLAVNKVERVLMPLPPLAEQKRIIAKLEELLPICKEKREREKEGVIQ